MDGCTCVCIEVCMYMGMVACVGVCMMCAWMDAGMGGDVHICMYDVNSVQTHPTDRASWYVISIIESPRLKVVILLHTTDSKLARSVK